MCRQTRGGKLKDLNWEGNDYMNDDNINKYCQAKYPYYKFLPTGWNKYSGDNSKTLCYNAIALVVIPDSEKKEWYWFDKVVPIMNRKCINTRSSNEVSCHKQYMSEPV